MGRITTLRRLANHLLGGQLDQVVSELRSAGHSWDQISKEVWARTDKTVNVSGQTLQGWYR